MSLTFKVELSELASERLRKLDRAVRDRIVRKLERVSEDPRRFIERLPTLESFKLRVGDYRVIIDLDWDSQILYVLTLGHRSLTYD